MAMLTKNAMWKALQRDLALVGFRNRRAHDLRRTGISLYRNAGAIRDVLNWATHGRSTIDDYTNMDWETLCREITKLRLAPAQPAADAQATEDELRDAVILEARRSRTLTVHLPLDLVGATACNDNKRSVETPGVEPVLRH
jgi:hypothetical protein